MMERLSQTKGDVRRHDNNAMGFPGLDPTTEKNSEKISEIKIHSGT